MSIQGYVMPINFRLLSYIETGFDVVLVVQLVRINRVLVRTGVLGDSESHL